MSAPSATPRQDPAGIMLENGYRSLITLAANPDIKFWEISVKPPGVDGGEPIDLTTMHNDEWRTFAPRTLKMLTPVSAKVAYDPAVRVEAEDLVNVRTTVTITYPDGTTDAFYGFLRSIEFDDLVEGTRPEATINVQPTNYDPVNYSEEAPVMVEVSGS